MDSKTRLRKLAEAATIRIESNIPIRYQNMYLGDIMEFILMEKTFRQTIPPFMNLLNIIKNRYELKMTRRPSF